MLVVPPGSVPSNVSHADAERAPDEKHNESTSQADERDVGSQREAEGGGGASGGGGGGDDEGGNRGWTMGICALPSACCVCIEMGQIQSCLRSEKICILPILACLLSLALCTAGLKWVFVDKIFEYKPPTYSDPKRIEQGPLIISADPTLGLPVSFPRLLSSSAPPSPNTIRSTTASQDFTVGARPSAALIFTKGTPVNASTVLTHRADEPAASRPPSANKQIPFQQNTMEFNDIIFTTIGKYSNTFAVFFFYDDEAHVQHIKYL